MKIAALCMGLLALSTSCSRVPEQTFLLPPSQGPALASQCSRQSFVADGYWRLTAQQAGDFDRVLRTTLARPTSHEIAGALGSLDRYHRQLIGFTRNGHRFIYANIYLVPRPPEIRKFMLGAEATQAVEVCDGGPEAWGAIFDLQAGKITAIDTSGIMGGGACHWDLAGRHPVKNETCGCVGAGPTLKRPRPPLPRGLRYCPFR